MIRAALAASAVLLLAGCGGSGGEVERVLFTELPPNLRQSQHLLGQAHVEMSRRPNPRSILVLPRNLEKRHAKNGFFDPKVRAWARRTVRAERRFDAHIKSIYSDTMAISKQARTLAHQLEPTDVVSRQLIDTFDQFATAYDQWVRAETAVAGELLRTLEILNESVAEHESLLAEIRAGVLGSQQEVRKAISARIQPLLRELQASEQRLDALITQDEKAGKLVNRRADALVDLLRSDDQAHAVGMRISEDDPDGIFARMRLY